MKIELEGSIHFMIRKRFEVVSFLSLLFSLLLVISCHSYLSPYLHNTTRMETKERISPVKPNPNSIYHSILATIYSSAWDQENAIKELKKALLHDPDSPYLLTELALSYTTTFQYDRAMTELKKVERIAPDYLPARLLMGNIYMIKKDPVNAKKEFEEAIRIDPTKEEAYFSLVQLMIKEGKYGEALNILSRFEKNCQGECGARSRSDSNFLKARIHILLKDNERAEFILEDIIKNDPEYYPAYETLIDLLINRGLKWKASEYYLSLITLFPEKLFLKNQLIDLYIETQRYQEALDLVYELEADEEIEVVDLQAQIRIKLQRGLAFIGLNDYPSAIEAFKEALKIQENNELVIYYIASSLEDSERFDEALEYCDRISSDSEFYLDTMLVKASAIYKEGDKGSAVRLFEELLDKTKGKLDDSLKVLWHMYKTGEKESALKRLDLLLSQVEETEKVSIYQLISSIHDEEGEFDSAVSALEAALKIEPANSNIKYLYAFELDKAGRRENAIRVIKDILEKEPDNPSALNFLGYTYAEEGINLEEARILIEKALRFRPEDGYIIDSLGWVFFKEGKYDEAVKTLERATRFSPNEPVILDHLGDAYEKIGSIEMAFDSYKKSLSILEKDKKGDRKLIEKLKKKMADLTSKKMNSGKGNKQNPR